MERIVIEIDKRTKDAFKKKADAEGHTMAFLLRRFVDRYVKEQQKGKAG